jgi:integrase
MRTKTWQRRPFIRHSGEYDPNLQYFRDWPTGNRGFYAGFYKWLKSSSYSASTLNIYCVGVRQALGFLKKPYWQIDPTADLASAWAYLQSRPTSQSTQEGYRKGLAKFGEYLRLRLKQPKPEKEIDLGYFLDELPGWLADRIKDYFTFSSRSWRPERRIQAGQGLLSRLTRSLRWIFARHPLRAFPELTPDVWYAYLDARLGEGISPTTVNNELLGLQSFLRFLNEQEIPICQRVLLLPLLEEAKRLPRDVPVQLLRQFYLEIQKDVASEHVGVHRMGVTDTAWFLLMLHCGLRTCEVRSLKLSDIDWEQRQVRIEQSKGLKDRFVYLSQAVIGSLKNYLDIRGPAEALPDHVFIFRHEPLSASYCYERLQTYGERCGVQITPHQHRHSWATLLLNAGAPILTVQAILGHKQIGTTLGYARLYDGTIARDYFKAMEEVERNLVLVEAEPQTVSRQSELIALVDSLRSGALSESQISAVQALRERILDLAM